MNLCSFGLVFHLYYIGRMRTSFRLAKISVTDTVIVVELVLSTELRGLIEAGFTFNVCLFLRTALSVNNPSLSPLSRFSTFSETESLSLTHAKCKLCKQTKWFILHCLSLLSEY